MSALKCKYCESPFDYEPNRRGPYPKFCSDECRQLHTKGKVRNRKKNPRLGKWYRCLTCNTVYKSTKSKGYCSKACYNCTQPLKNLFTCQECGKQYHAKSHKYHTYCSRECYFKSKRDHDYWPYTNTVKVSKHINVLECEECGMMFVYKRSDKKYCSRDCELAKANRHERVKAAVIWAFTPGVRKVCVWCDREYIAYPKRASVSRYCCGECRDSVYAKSKSFYNRRRAHRLRSAYVEPVNVKVLHARDGGVCQICGGKVDIDLPYPHPKSASIDHIVPVSKDGEHSYKNTRLTHFMCNVYRGNDNTAQLRLF